jgi:hypothetical protein
MPTASAIHAASLGFADANALILSMISILQNHAGVSHVPVLVNENSSP